MTGVDLLALALATRACLDAWLDPDSILGGLRARTQTWESWFWRTLANCRFCVSYWVPAGPLFLLTLSTLLPAPWALAVKLPVYALAATGLVALLDLIEDRLASDRGGASTKDPDDTAPAAAGTGPPADVP